MFIKNKKTILILLLLLILIGVSYLFFQKSIKDKIGDTVNDNKTVELTDKDKENEVNDKREKDLFVYETEAENADECSSFESYDSKTKVCYFECGSDAECKQIQKSIDDEIESWTDEKYADDKFKEPVNYKIEDNIIAEYSVNKAENLTLKTGKDTEENKQIWKHVSGISPGAFTDKYIETFQVFNDTKTDTLAFVDDEDQNGKWRVAVNLAGYKSFTLRERNLTIVHELGHVITLNQDQVSANVDEESCKNYFIDEGCAITNSYLNNFVSKFWTLAEILKNKKEKSEFSSSLYKKDKFITEYAATNPVEDMAESFAYFVIDKKSESTEIKDQKYNHFYTFPELLKVREDMKKGIITDIVRARKLGVK